MKAIKYLGEPSLRQRWLFLYFAGMAVGILFANLSAADADQVFRLCEYLIREYRRYEVQNDKLFWYCFRERAGMFFFIAVSGLTIFGPLYHGICLIWFGFSFGALVSYATIKFGLKGILLCICGVVPQNLVYIPVVAAMLYSGWRIGKEELTKKILIIYLLVFLLLFVLLILGIFIESYVNPVLLKKILQIY